MLSKVEMEFWNSPEKFNGAYARALRHRIKAKTAQQHKDMLYSTIARKTVTVLRNFVTLSITK